MAGASNLDVEGFCQEPAELGAVEAPIVGVEGLFSSHITVPGIQVGKRFGNGASAGDECGAQPF